MKTTEKLEKSIIGKMNSIKKGKNPSLTYIGLDFKRMSRIDPVLYNELLQRYKKVLKSLNK